MYPKNIRGPYRDRTGDLHNAIVALSHAELTALRDTQYSQVREQCQRECYCSAGEICLHFFYAQRPSHEISHHKFVICTLTLRSSAKARATDDPSLE